MDRRIVAILLSLPIVALAVLAVVGTGKLWGVDNAARSAWSPTASEQYLDGRAVWWLNWTGAARGNGTACISCHTSMPVALALPALDERLGSVPEGAGEMRLINDVKSRVANWDTIASDNPGGNAPCVTYYADRKPSSLGTESVLNALVLVNYDSLHSPGLLSASTSTALGYLWDEQHPDGSWLWLDFGLSPWEKDGAYYGSALAAVAVGMASKNYYDRPDLQPKVAALKSYLQTQYASRPLHDRVVCLWASTWLPGLMADSDRKVLIQDLIEVQEPDGGWSLPKLGTRSSGTSDWQSQGAYPAGSTSDGYATGLVVLALNRAGVAANNPNLQRGIAWLETNQVSGAWPANYLNEYRDPQTDIGMFMRDASTSFAVMALDETKRR